MKPHRATAASLIATALVLLLTTLQIIAQTPILGSGFSDAPVAVVRPVQVSSDDHRGGSDDAVAKALQLREAPASGTETRRLVGSPPSTVAHIGVPESIDVVARTRGIAVTQAMREQATQLYQRIVPTALRTTIAPEVRNAALAFIAIGPRGAEANDACVSIGAGQRAGLVDAFWRTQGFLPESDVDYQFACALVMNPSSAVDVTKVFPDHRHLALEQYAIKNFVSIFGRLPSKRADGSSLPKTEADRDWWAVKYMTYFPVLDAGHRNLSQERACINAFTKAQVALYQADTSGGFQRVTKQRGMGPESTEQWSVIRACAYSGAPFLEQFSQK